MKETPESIAANSMEAKSASIIHATVELISQGGIESVRLQDVAQLAGVSVGAIQYHFSSRTDLIDQAMQRHAREWLEAITPPADTESAWESLCAMFYAIAQRGQGGADDRVWLMMNSSALTNIAHLRIAQQIDYRWRSMFREIIVRGMTASEFLTDAPVESNVEQIMAAVDGFALKSAVYGVPGEETTSPVYEALCRLAKLLLQPVNA